jgi:pimeloyl-ACP methyl ester carboxylesterase
MVALRTALYRLPGAGAVHRAVRRADNTDWQLDRSAIAQTGVAPLILRGEHGHIPTAVLEDVAMRAKGRLVSIPGSRQWPHYENPTVVNEYVDHYLKETTR